MAPHCRALVLCKGQRTSIIRACHSPCQLGSVRGLGAQRRGVPGVLHDRDLSANRSVPRRLVRSGGRWRARRRRVAASFPPSSLGAGISTPAWHTWQCCASNCFLNALMVIFFATYHSINLFPAPGRPPYLKPHPLTPYCLHFSGHHADKDRFSAVMWKNRSEHHGAEA